MNEIASWRRKKIKDIGTVVGGGTPSTKRSDYYADPGAGIGWITPKDLSGYKSRYISHGARDITEKGLKSSSARMLPQGSILFSSRAPIGYVAIAEQPLCTNQGFKSIIPNENVDSEFLYYLMRIYAPKIEGTAGGSTFAEISGSALGNFEIVLPRRIEEQRAIVSMLAPFDQKIEANNQINDNLSKQIAFIYESWFKHFDFPNKDGRPYASSGGPFVNNNEFGKALPSGWKMASLGNNPISKVIRSGVRPFKEKEYLETANISGIGVEEGEIVSYENRPTRANMQPSLYSVWFAKMKDSIKHLFISGRGDELVEKYILSTGFVGIQCDEISFPYISSFISDPAFEVNKDLYSHGTTQLAINLDDLKLFEIVIPERSVLEKFASLTNPMFEKINANSSENAYLVKMRDALLTKLINPSCF